LHIQGCNAGEIAKVLGWTEPKARNLLYRGLNDLRTALVKEGVELEAIQE
jgi:DNA-directed RNA polymerase specialized sigma24 family protein